MQRAAHSPAAPAYLCCCSIRVSLTCSATADPGPLNRAEYIKYIAAFFNKEAQANVLFNQTVARYEAIKAAAAKAAAGEPPPCCART